MKVQYKQRVHKLASDIKTIADLLTAINNIFKDALPQYYALQYQDEGGDIITIQNNEDLQIAFSEFKTKVLKIEIVSIQNEEMYNSLMSQSKIQESKKQEEAINQPIDTQQQQIIEKVEPIEQHLGNEVITNKPQQQQNNQMQESCSDFFVQFENKQNKLNLEEFNQQFLEKEEAKQQQQQQEQVIVESKFYYNCFRCDKKGALDCQLCNGKGRIAEDDDIILLINQVLDRRLGVNQQQQPQQPNKIEKMEIEKPLKEEDYFFDISWFKKSNRPFRVVKKFISDMFSKKEEEQSQKKDFNAGFVEDMVSNITVPKNSAYNWKVAIKNTGRKQWPDTTSLVCMEGEFKGFHEPIDALHPGQVTELTLQLLAPEKAGKQMVSFRLQYKEGEKTESFGPKFCYELITTQEEKKVEQQPKSGIICKEVSKKKNNNNLTVNDKLTRQAKVIQQVFSEDDTKKIIKIIQDYGLGDLDDNSLVDAYSQRIL